MTNWLDPAEVRADKAALEANPCCDMCVLSWPETAKGRVLEAIAALPEPDATCAAIASEVGLEFDCESKEPCGWEEVSQVHRGKKPYVHAYQEPQFHRIWRIARVVCGKEEGREG